MQPGSAQTPAGLAHGSGVRATRARSGPTLDDLPGLINEEVAGLDERRIRTVRVEIDFDEPAGDDG